VTELFLTPESMRSVTAWLRRQVEQLKKMANLRKLCFVSAHFLILQIQGKLLLRWHISVSRPNLSKAKMSKNAENVEKMSKNVELIPKMSKKYRKCRIYVSNPSWQPPT
jgi:hypothetical protein